MKVKLKTLRRYWDEETSEKILRLLDGTDEPTSYETVEAWVRRCYNRPSDAELIGKALNEILDGCGVEAIRGRYVDSYHIDIQAVFIELGDSYDATLLLDHETGDWTVTSWGDWVEQNEKERELI